MAARCGEKTRLRIGGFNDFGNRAASRETNDPVGALTRQATLQQSVRSGVTQGCHSNSIVIGASWHLPTRTQGSPKDHTARESAPWLALNRRRRRGGSIPKPASETARAFFAVTEATSRGILVGTGCPPAFVKPEAPPFTPRYRNDIVFRSAQRLLASPPKKPTRKRPSRAIVFLLGLACGLGVAFLLLRATREAASPTPNGDTATRTTFGVRKRLDPPRLNASPAVGAAAPAFQATTTAPAEEPPAPEAPAPTAGRRPVPRIAPPPTSASRLAPPPQAPTTLIRFTTSLTLRGSLFSSTAAPVDVAFTLFLIPGPQGTAIHGSVRFFDEANLLSFHRLAGRLENRTVTVSETVPAPAGRPSPAAGRMFVIEMPTDPRSDEISGSWVHGTKHGTLTLKSVLPL
jgi:hypothetical protein